MTGPLDSLQEALRRQLLPRRDPEDPKSCELHRFILSKVSRFRCPEEKRQWARLASHTRRTAIREIYLRGHPKRLLDEKPRVRWRGVIKTGKGYRIRKLMYEGFPGMWIPALLYEPDGIKGRVPAVLNPNGHHIGGKAMPYKQARCINLAKRGMLALSTEFIGMGELSMNINHGRIAHLDLCGKAGVAVFYLAMKRGLDVLLSHPNCDPRRVAMTGLSGGGWQTAVLSALDERVRVVVPVAGHSPIWQRPSCTADIGDLEQAPVDLCTVADYDLLTALFAPRPALLIYNEKDDCCFRPERTKVSIYEPVKPLYDLLGVPDNIEFYVNVDPGTHNYEADNRAQLYRFLNRHFGLQSPERDLPYEDELLSESQLRVGLPEDNATLISLAKEAAMGLPRLSVPRGLGPKREAWLQRSRARLEKVIRLHRYSVRDEVVQRDEQSAHHLLHMDDEWTLPVTVLLAKGETKTEARAGQVGLECQAPGHVQVLLSDAGRGGLVQLCASHIAQGRTVVAADVFGTGECRYPAQYQMLLGTVGERPLGVLTGQILALLEWAASSARDGRVGLGSAGPIVSFASLCAAALNPGILSNLYLDGLYDSLKRLIELPVEYESAVPLFCFGLLREFDVPELLAMTEDLPIERPGHGPAKPILGGC